jgi:uncharacterized Zn-binding protein involved in type VI secretion
MASEGNGAMAAISRHFSLAGRRPPRETSPMIRAFLCVTALTACSFAQAQTPQPPTDTQKQESAAECGGLLGGAGSPNVSIEGRSAGRLGDMACVRVIDSSASVRINGRPALRVGDRVLCQDGRIGVIVGGAHTVKINGHPAATAESRIQGCD